MPFFAKILRWPSEKGRTVNAVVQIALQPDVFRTFRVYIQWGRSTAALDFTRQRDCRKADIAVGAG